MLLFQGDVSVSSLFQFLLKYSYPDDLPMLFAPVAFANAAISQAQIKSNGTILKQGAVNHEVAYNLELSGLLSPLSIIRICELLSKTQRNAFSVTFQINKSTTGFNYAVPSNKESTFPHVVPLPPQMREPSILGNSVIKKVSCTDGKFIITM